MSIEFFQSVSVKIPCSSNEASMFTPWSTASASWSSVVFSHFSLSHLRPPFLWRKLTGLGIYWVEYTEKLWLLKTFPIEGIQDGWVRYRSWNQSAAMQFCNHSKVRKRCIWWVFIVFFALISRNWLLFFSFSPENRTYVPLDLIWHQIWYQSN